MQKFYRHIFTAICLMSCFTVTVYAGVQSHYQIGMESPIDAAVTTKAQVPEDNIDAYKLDSGDKIKVHIFGEDDMDVEVRLGASGDIRYPFLGKIHVAGMTLASLERKIAADLNGRYLIDPQVRVSMEEFRPFYVNGEVKSPGAYPYQPGMTVRKAISVGGGFSDNADENKLFLIKANSISKNEVRVRLAHRVSPGDIVAVKKSFFFVNGEVKNPDKYVYKSGMTYRMAISMAGGLKEKADIDTLTVIHTGKGNHVQKVDDIDAAMAPDDVITIKQSFF